MLAPSHIVLFTEVHASPPTPGPRHERERGRCSVILPWLCVWEEGGRNPDLPTEAQAPSARRSSNGSPCDGERAMNDAGMMLWQKPIHQIIRTQLPYPSGPVRSRCQFPEHEPRRHLELGLALPRWNPGILDSLSALCSISLQGPGSGASDWRMTRRHPRTGRGRMGQLSTRARRTLRIPAHWPALFRVGSQRGAGWDDARHPKPFV